MRWFKVVIITLCIVFGIAVMARIYLYSQIPFGWQQVTIMVPRGTGSAGIAELLARQGVITDPWIFRILAWVEGKSRRMEAGEYEFTPLMTPHEVLNRIVKGEIKVYRLTIVEGWTMKEIAAYLESEKLVKADEFLALCHAPEILARVGTGVTSLEGYLFPDTYNTRMPTSAPQIIGMLLQRAAEKYSPEFVKRQEELGMTRHEIITLASIIEKEAKVAEERPLVSSVFHNRLKRNMPLGADPTVVYGLTDFSGVIHKSDLANPHPYNTYIHAGLPPGPIASPGWASIKAALWPADTQYLYFVSKNDGTHHFSETAAEHDAMVKEYQR